MNNQSGKQTPLVALINAVTEAMIEVNREAQRVAKRLNLDDFQKDMLRENMDMAFENWKRKLHVQNDDELKYLLSTFKNYGQPSQTVSQLSEEETVYNWFDDNGKFAEWFAKSGLSPFTTSYEDAYKQYRSQSQS